jgi:hypothetical protein
VKQYLIFATWTLLAGVGIPLIGVLNSGMAGSIGNPRYAYQSQRQRWIDRRGTREALAQQGLQAAKLTALCAA